MKKIDLELEAEIVRLHLGEHMRLGEIARLLDVHHSVVRRVIAPIKSPVPSMTPRPRKIDAYLSWMEDMLAKYPKICASRLFAMAQERGYGGGLSQLRASVRTLRPRPKPEAFLRLHKLPGEEAQVDWAHFGKYVVGRACRPLMMFAMTLSHSRAVFLRFFHDAKMANFQAGHVEGLRFLGGVPRVILYDNLKSAVLERVGVLKRFNPDLLELAKHYRFEPRTARPGRGNEKGRVERTIRYVRDSFFAAREFVSLEQINAQAIEWCHTIAAQRPWADDRQRCIQEIWDEERLKLRPLPLDDFAAWERIDVSVGKTPYIRFDLNDYSVPHTYVRQRVTVIANESHIRVMDKDNLLAVHERTYDKGAVVENADHVMDLVNWKRQGNESSTQARLVHAVPCAKKWLEIAAMRGQNLGHQTRKLHEYLLIYGAHELDLALTMVENETSTHLPSLQIRLDEARSRRGQSSPPVAVTLPSKRLEHVVVRPHDLEEYAALNVSRKGRTDEET